MVSVDLFSFFIGSVVPCLKVFVPEGDGQLEIPPKKSWNNYRTVCNVHADKWNDISVHPVEVSLRQTRIYNCFDPIQIFF